MQEACPQTIVFVIMRSGRSVVKGEMNYLMILSNPICEFWFPSWIAPRLDIESETIMDFPISELLIMSSAILIACNSAKYMEALLGWLVVGCLGFMAYQPL